MNKKAKSVLFVSLISLTLSIFVFYFVVADMSVTINGASSASTYWSANLNQLYNFSITSAGPVNLNKTNFTFSGLTLIVGTNGTNARGLNVNTTNSIWWINNTGGLVNASVTNYFWFNLTGLNGLHNVTIVSTDQNGQTNTTIINITLDTIAPTIDFQSTTLVNNGNVTGKTSSIIVNVTANDSLSNVWQTINIYNSSNDRVGEYNYNNQVSPKNVDTAVPFYSENNLSDGIYTFNVTVTDAAGNSNKTATRTFRVDSSAPKVTFIQPINYVNTSATGIFVLNATINDTGVGVVQSSYFNITYSNGTQISTYRASLHSGIKYSNSSWNITSYSDGAYKVYFWANDSLNNINNTEVVNFILDRTAPVLSLSSTINKSTIILNIGATDTSGLNGSCTTSRGTLSGFTVTESGLDCATNYTYNVTCYDQVGLLGNITKSFTTSDCDINPDSSKSGSATLSTPVLAEGVQKFLMAGAVVKFSVANQQHSILVQSIKNGKVTIKIASEPQYVSLGVGQEAKADLNGDKVYDLYLKLNSISSNNVANLTMRTISEAMTANVTGVLVQNASTGVVPTPGVTNSTGSKLWIWITLVVLIIAVLAIWYYFYNRRFY